MQAYLEINLKIHNNYTEKQNIDADFMQKQSNLRLEFKNLISRIGIN